MPVLLPFGPLQTMSNSCARCWLISSESKSRKTVRGLVWSRPAQANVCCCEQINNLLGHPVACCLHIPCCEYILVTRHFEFRRRLQRPHNVLNMKIYCRYITKSIKQKLLSSGKKSLVLHVIRICLDLRHVILIALGNLGRTCRLKLCLDMLEAAVLNQCQNRIEPNLHRWKHRSHSNDSV